MPENQEALQRKLPIEPLKMFCPKCNSSQFSIIVPPDGMRPEEWSDNIIGGSDCRGCYQDFLVALPTELSPVLIPALKRAVEKCLFVKVIEE